MYRVWDRGEGSRHHSLGQIIASSDVLSTIRNDFAAWWIDHQTYAEDIQIWIVHDTRTFLSFVLLELELYLYAHSFAYLASDQSMISG